MSSKKRKRKEISNRSPLRTHWRVEDTEQLIAYLDYGARDRFSADEINEGAAKQLALTTGFVQSQHQIAAKIRSLWDEWGDPDADASEFDRIYREGSACLRYFKNQEQADRVRLLADELKAQALQRAEEEMHERLATPRKLRSGSTPGTARQSGRRLTRSARQTLTPSFAEQREVFVQTPSRATRQTPAHQNTKWLFRDSLSTTDTEIRVFKAETSPDRSAAGGLRTIRRRSSSSLSATTELGSPSEASVPETLSHTASASSDSAQWQTHLRPERQNLAVDQEHLSNAEEDCSKGSTPLSDSLQDLRERKNQDIRYWKRRAIDAENEAEEIKQINDNMRSQVAASARGVAGILERVNLLETHNAELNQRERRRESTQQLEKMIQEGPGQISIVDLDNDMIKLRQDISKFCQTEEFEGSSLTSEAKSLIESMKLQRMAASASRRDAKRAALVQPAVNSLECRTSFVEILGLAVSNWVLAADVRELFWDTGLHRGRDNPYEMMCELIMQRDSELCRTLDFEVHRRMRQDPYFDDLCIPQRASKLANDFFDIFIGQKQGENGNMDLRSRNRIRDRLTNLFKQAFKIRVQLMLSTSMFECRVYEAGTRFDSNCMDAHVLASSEVSKTNQHKLCVRNTLLPAIIPKQLDRTRVSYGSMISHEICTPGEEPWSKAFVVLEE